MPGRHVPTPRDRPRHGMIEGTMYGFVGRNSVIVGATVAGVLLVVQIRTSGIDNYAFADVLSILLVTVPLVARALRPPAPRRRRDGPPQPAGEAADPAAPARPRRPEPQDPDVPRPVEGLLVRGFAILVAAGAWSAAVVFVLLQAWAPTLSALIVFGAAAIAIPTESEDTRVAPSSGAGHG
jgi:hypothetical protein